MDANVPKILLCADDDPDDRELLCETAMQIDPALKVIHCVHGKELLEKLKELESAGIHPCLIILDMNMPIMDGQEALKEIKANRQWDDIPVAIFTTSQREFYRHLETEYGVSIVTKPDKFAAIVQEVRQLLSYCRAA